MERIVIVGGTGNISVSITRLLVEKGYDVTCFNRGVTKAEEIPDCVHIITGDRWDRPAFEKVMQEGAFDYAIDMICFDAEDAKSDIRAFRGVKQMIYTSTTCVFGVDYDYLPVDENHEKRPFTVYGKNKSIAEEVFLKAYREEGFPITILRPSSTYGNQSGMVGNVGETNLWIDRIRKGKPVLLCGSGSTARRKAILTPLFPQHRAPAAACGRRGAGLCGRTGKAALHRPVLQSGGRRLHGMARLLQNGYEGAGQGSPHGVRAPGSP